MLNYDISLLLMKAELSRFATSFTIAGRCELCHLSLLSTTGAGPSSMRNQDQYAVIHISCFPANYSENLLRRHFSIEFVTLTVYTNRSGGKYAIGVVESTSAVAILQCINNTTIDGRRVRAEVARSSWDPQQEIIKQRNRDDMNRPSLSVKRPLMDRPSSGQPLPQAAKRVVRLRQGDLM